MHENKPKINKNNNIPLYTSETQLNFIEYFKTNIT